MQGKIKRLARLVRFLKKLKRLVLPQDVEEGHFAVLAGNGEEKKRFEVGLHHLKNPKFVRLLDQAAEEYGFKNDGLIVVPCLPDELQKILADGA